MDVKFVLRLIIDVMSLLLTLFECSAHLLLFSRAWYWTFIVRVLMIWKRERPGNEVGAPLIDLSTTYRRRVEHFRARGL